MGFQFDDETTIDPSGDDGRWSTQISSAWNIGDNPNGGYLTASMVRAMRELADEGANPHPDPMTITTHFLRPGTGDAGAEIEVEPVRSGRTITTLRGRTTQDGKTRIESIAAFADLSPTPNAVELNMAPIDLPPPEDCINRVHLEQGVHLPILDRLDVLVHPDHAEAGHSDKAEITGWIRFTDERPVDTHALTLFADAFPPPLFALLGYIGWVPTIELTVHVRRRPVTGWVRGHFQVTDTVGNRMIEDGVLWDESGSVVARSRQIGLILTA